MAQTSLFGNIRNRLAAALDTRPRRVDAGDGGAMPAPHLTGQDRFDEWENIISGHGIEGRDARTESKFVCSRVSHSEARELWAGDDIARKVIELLPRAMMREGYKIRIADLKDEKKVAEAMIDVIDTLGINRAFRQAKEYERAYGGAAIWPVLNDQTDDTAKPLNEDGIATVRYYQVFEPRELIPDRYYTDPSNPKFGKPETYRVIAINGGGVGFGLQTVIHESRLVIFEGVRVSRELPLVESIGWGDSELTRVRAVLRDFHLSWSSVAALLKDFSQGVYKYEGLTDMLAQDGDKLVKRRLAINDWAKSVFNALVLDSKDDYERKSTSMAGAPEILVQFATRLAAACDTPVTKLLGMSPAGMNATGESDTRGWYETVSEEQEDDRPLLERCIRFSFLSLDGPTKGIEPDVWSVEFNPLWAPSAKEQAETRLVVQQADTMAIDAQMVSPEEVAKSRWGGDTYSDDMHIDWKEREKQLLAGAAEIAAGASADVQQQALNGAQISSLLEIVGQVATKAIPRESGVAIIALAFQLQPAQAEDLLGDAGKDFVPAPPPAKANPFAAPAAKPDPTATDTVPTFDDIANKPRKKPNGVTQEPAV